MEYKPEQIDSIVREANRLRSEELGRLIAAGRSSAQQLAAFVMHKLNLSSRPAHR